jgi:hypothetical protein
MTALINNHAKLGAGMMLMSGGLILLSVLALFLFFLFEIMTAMAQYTPMP